MREMIIETRTIKNILEKLRFNCCNIFLRIDFYSPNLQVFNKKPPKKGGSVPKAGLEPARGVSLTGF